MHRHIAALVAAGALALAIAPAGHAHSLSYSDPIDSRLHGYDDLVGATVNHYEAPGPWVRPPITLEHTVTTASPYGVFRPALWLMVGSTGYTVSGTTIRRWTDSANVGTAQVTDGSNTVTYRFAVSAIGNPSSYQWSAQEWTVDGWTDAIPNSGWLSHTVRQTFTVAPQ